MSHGRFERPTETAALEDLDEVANLEKEVTLLMQQLVRYQIWESPEIRVAAAKVFPEPPVDTIVLDSGRVVRRRPFNGRRAIAKTVKVLNQIAKNYGG